MCISGVYMNFKHQPLLDKCRKLGAATLHIVPPVALLVLAIVLGDIALFIGAIAVAGIAVMSEIRRRRLKKILGDINHLTHDLRLPIQAIGNSIGIVPDCPQTETITKSVEMMSVLIDQMPGQRSMRAVWEEISVSALLYEVVTMNLTMARRKGVLIRHDSNVKTISCDKFMITRLLINLVTNAIHHSGCKNVLIAIMKDGDLLSVSVKDDGKGITMSSAAVTGTGLRIVTAMAASMGGEADIRNMGDGTLATVTIPQRRDLKTREPRRKSDSTTAAA